MPISSRWSTPTPEVSLQRWVFGSSFDPLPDRKILFDADSPKDNFLTLSDFRLLSKRVALGLQKAGLNQGDRVLVCSGNNLQFPAVFMGVLMAGGIFTGASPAFKAQELAHQLRDSGASFAIVSDIILETALDACSRVNMPRSRIFTFGTSQRGDGVRCWTDLLAPASEAERFDWLEPQDPRSATCCLNYSSGTTGVPKGVEITHFSYVANGEATIFMRSQALGSQEGLPDASLCFMPMYHAAGQTTFIANNPRMGVPTYIMPSYSFEKMLQHVQSFKITTLMSAPPILLALAKNELASRYDLSSLRDMVCGTAPLAPEIAEEVEKKVWPRGQTFVTQGWGMTEITCSGTLWSADDKQKTASVGEVVPNASFKLMDNGKEVTEPHKPGELWFSGPTLMKGYWRNPQASADAVSHEGGKRWLKTGDVAYVDRYGPGAKIFLVDRIKDLIKSRGFQVSPVELEALLLERKDIVDAAVVGVVVAGEEVPRAFVVTNSSNTSAEEIQRWLDDRVAKYKRLRGGVVFVDSIPRLQSGKILRRELRQRAEREVGTVKAKLS